MIIYDFFSVLSLEHMKVLLFWDTKVTSIVALKARHNNFLYTRANYGATNKRNYGKGIPVASIINPNYGSAHNCVISVCMSCQLSRDNKISPGVVRHKSFPKK